MDLASKKRSNSLSNIVLPNAKKETTNIKEMINDNNLLRNYIYKKK